MARGFAMVVMAAVIGGCAQSSRPYNTAPVSGVIKLDGQALAGAHVTFMPEVDSQASRQSGPEARGDTDSDGRYALTTVFGDHGASLGKNRVMISTRKTELDPSNPDKSKEVARERVPARYFTDQAPLVFDVPSEGTNAANFELTTK
jgi:hypothetical protein